MNEKMKQIALRVRELREILDMTTAEVANLAGIREDLYCDYENGNIEITVSDLYSIAAALQIDPTALLTGETPKMGLYTIVRNGQGEDLERHQGYTFSSLAANYAGRDMEPMLVYLKNDVKEVEIVQHNGQEFNYVLQGTITVAIKLTKSSTPISTMTTLTALLGGTLRTACHYLTGSHLIGQFILSVEGCHI